jgi:hypothetical protein
MRSNQVIGGLESRRKEGGMEARRITIEIPHIPLEEQEKYKGMDVALIDGKIVAAGYSSFEVYQKARELFPEKEPEEILLDYIPREEVLIL